MISDAEKEAFVRNGFITKQGMLPPEACRRCIDVAWEALASLGITRDPNTWRRARKRRGVVKLRDEVQNNKTLGDILVEHGEVMDVVQDLMGLDIEDHGVRGLYPTLPIPRRISRVYEPHIENHPCQVVVMYYLDNVTTQNGGLLVWPGSHRPVYFANDKVFDYYPNDQFQPTFQSHNFQTPYECTGQTGDAVFFHHRLLHSGSNNFRNTIRFGILRDFIPKTFESLRGKRPTTDDLWSYWSDGIRETAAGLTDLSPTVIPKRSIVRPMLIGSLQTLRRLKGSPVNDYVNKRKRGEPPTDTAGGTCT